MYMAESETVGGISQHCSHLGDWLILLSMYLHMYVCAHQDHVARYHNIQM